MAPEAKNRDIPNYGPHTDAYAFGILAYELLVGRDPPATLTPDGNAHWYNDSKDAKFVFDYPLKVEGEPNNENTNFGEIGAELKKMIVGLTVHDVQDRWSTDKALKQLKTIMDLHEAHKSGL